MAACRNLMTSVLSVSVVFAALLSPCESLRGADTGAVAVTKVDSAKLKAARARAVEFLTATQASDGSWTTSKSPGISGLVTYSLLRSGVSPEEPVVRKALAHLQTFIQPDGGVYSKDSSHRNYETSVVLLAFHAANRNGKYDSLIANARDFLKKLQWDEGEGTKREDVAFGGAGYGKSQRPDLSNTTFLLDALQAAGVGKDDPSVQNALVFVSRCQNLESEANTTKFAAKVNDGGFYYTPAAGGSSQAGADENGGLRSYASMTYAGLKSMIYAGLSTDDPRVKAAVGWIKKHYSLTENPGMGQQGLYYYYHTFAKALDALKTDEVQDAQGQQHNWRAELADHLISLQKENGSWVNPQKRWYEGDPNLATAYSLMALAYCEAPTGK